MKTGQPGVEAIIKDVKMAQITNGNSTGKTERAEEPRKSSPVPPVFTETVTPFGTSKIQF